MDMDAGNRSRAFAMSLLELPLATADECDGAEPSLVEVLADARAIEPIVPAAYPRRAEGGSLVTSPGVHL